jgi:sugar lactone lactonase YvrE
MLAGDVLMLSADGAVSRRHVGHIAAALRPRRKGGAVIGIERGFALEDADGSLTQLEELWRDDGTRMNEGACDPDGRFYCGSMAYDKQTGAGALYRLDPNRSVEVVLEGVTISNGLDWSPDGSLAYYNDTATGQVDVFDYGREEGLRNRRRFVSTDARPDGLTVDADGGVWVAFSNGGAVRRYSPNGALDAVVELPVTKVTACTFGGEGLETIFITTSREDLAEDVEPQAGSLFRALPGVTGQRAREFAG